MHIIQLPHDTLLHIIELLDLHDFSVFYIQCKKLKNVWDIFKREKLSRYLSAISEDRIKLSAKTGRISKNKLHEFIFLSGNNELIELWCKKHKISLDCDMVIGLIRANTAYANEVIKSGYIPMSWNSVALLSMFFQNYDMLFYSMNVKNMREKIDITGKTDIILYIDNPVPDDYYTSIKQFLTENSQEEFYQILRLFTVSSWWDMADDDIIQIMLYLLCPKKCVAVPDITSVIYLCSISGSVEKLFSAISLMLHSHRKIIVDVMKKAAYDIIKYRNQKKYNVIARILDFAGQPGGSDIHETYIATLSGMKDLSGETELIRRIVGINRDLFNKIIKKLKPEQIFEIFPDLSDDPKKLSFALKYNVGFSFVYNCRNGLDYTDDSGCILSEYELCALEYDEYIPITTLINTCVTNPDYYIYIFDRMISPRAKQEILSGTVNLKKTEEKCYILAENMAKNALFPTFAEEQKYPRDCNIYDLIDFMELYRLNPGIILNIYRKNLPHGLTKNILMKYGLLCEYCTRNQ